MKFENKTAVITGGSRGIGLAIAKKLASQGANIAILYVGDESEGIAAKEALAEYMQDVEFAQPKVTIYSDYTAKPYEGDYKELVRAQVENPVRWQTIVENMIKDGVDTFIEIGVGKTLTGLIKRIDNSVKAFKVETPADFEALDL